MRREMADTTASDFEAKETHIDVNNGQDTSFNKCAIFWDYENCPAPNGSMTGYQIAECIRRTAHHFGAITLFKVHKLTPELF